MPYLMGFFHGFQIWIFLSNRIFRIGYQINAIWQKKHFNGLMPDFCWISRNFLGGFDGFYHDFWWIHLRASPMPWLHGSSHDWGFPHVSHVTSFVHLYQTLQSWLDSDEPQRCPVMPRCGLWLIGKMLMWLMVDRNSDGKAPIYHSVRNRYWELLSFMGVLYWHVFVWFT